MKASMERLETRSTFRSSGILPPRRRPAAPLSPGEPRRRFPEGGGPLLPWVGRPEGDEGAPLARPLPPAASPGAGGPAGAGRGRAAARGGGRAAAAALCGRPGRPPSAALRLRPG